MSAGWRSTLARFVRIRHPPERVETGLSKLAFGNPRPVRMFFALLSMSAIREGSTCDCKSTRRSLAACVSS
jgi:hypothetical protein